MAGSGRVESVHMARGLQLDHCPCAVHAQVVVDHGSGKVVGVHMVGADAPEVIQV